MALLVIAASVVENPSDVKTYFLASLGTVNLNVPSCKVDVPILVPLTVTDTPPIPDPSLLSITFPVTVLDCAKTVEREKKLRHSNAAILAIFVRFIRINLV